MYGCRLPCSLQTGKQKESIKTMKTKEKSWGFSSAVSLQTLNSIHFQKIHHILNSSGLSRSLHSNKDWSPVNGSLDIIYWASDWQWKWGTRRSTRCKAHWAVRRVVKVLWWSKWFGKGSNTIRQLIQTSSIWINLRIKKDTLIQQSCQLCTQIRMLHLGMIICMTLSPEKQVSDSGFAISVGIWHKKCMWQTVGLFVKQIYTASDF